MVTKAFSHDEKASKITFVTLRPIAKVRIADNYTRVCPKCGGIQKLELRQNGDTLYDQPYCGPCRNGGAQVPSGQRKLF